MDSSDFLIDCPFKFEWVESFKEIRESLFGFFFDMFGFQDSLVRCFGFIVTFDSFGSNAFFGQEFDGGDEEVVVEPPLVFVKVVHHGNDLGIFEALVPEPLTDVGPVFPFDVGVVVFLVFSGASELDGFISFPEIVEEEMIDKFSSVVKVNAEDRKRQGILHIFDFLCDFAEAFAIGGTLLGPARGNVDGIGGKGVVAFDGGAAVSDSVGFKESRPEFVPLPCFDGDVALEKEPGLGGALSFASVETLYGFEKAVDCRGRDSDEFFDEVEREITVVDLVKPDPVWDSGFKTF